MSLLTSSNTITRFKTYGVIKDNGSGQLETIRKEFNNAVFKDVQPSDEMSFGFTSVLTPFFPNFDESLITGTFITASIRIDKKTIPSKLVQKEYIIAEKIMLLNTGQEFLAKAQKSQLKEDVIGKLILETKAVPSLFDFVWDIDTESVYFFTSNKTAIEIIEDMFMDSFDIRLVRMFPFIMAEQIVSGDIVEKFRPSTFI